MSEVDQKAGWCKDVSNGESDKKDSKDINTVAEAFRKNNNKRLEKEEKKDAKEV